MYVTLNGQPERTSVVWCTKYWFCQPHTQVTWSQWKILNSAALLGYHQTAGSRSRSRQATDSYRCVSGVHGSLFFGMPFAIARHSNTGNTACQTKAKWFKHPTRRSDFQKYSEQKERKKRAVVLRQLWWAALDEEFKSHFLTSVAPCEGRREGGPHAVWARKPCVCVCVWNNMK